MKSPLLILLVAAIGLNGCTQGIHSNSNEVVPSLTGDSNAPLTPNQLDDLNAQGVELVTLYAQIQSAKEDLEVARKLEDGTYESDKGFNQMLVNVGLGGTLVSAGVTAIAAFNHMNDIEKNQETLRWLKSLQAETQASIVKKVKESNLERWIYAIEPSNPTRRANMVRGIESFGLRTGQMLESYFAGTLDSEGTKALFRNLNRIKSGTSVSSKIRSGKTFVESMRELTLLEDFTLINKKLNSLKRHQAHYAKVIETLKASKSEWTRHGLFAIGGLTAVSLVVSLGMNEEDLKVKKLDGATYEAILSKVTELEAQYGRAVAAYFQKRAELVEKGMIPVDEMLDVQDPADHQQSKNGDFEIGRAI